MTSFQSTIAVSEASNDPSTVYLRAKSKITLTWNTLRCNHCCLSKLVWWWGSCVDDCHGATFVVSGQDN